jgi:hypothetical protein
MRRPVRVKGGEDERARARLLAHFEDHPESVFYSRQLEVLFENEYFHWVTNRAVGRLIGEGRVFSETRQLSIGSSVKLLWHRKFRFYKRAAREVFDLVDRYSKAASEGALGLQGETMVLKAFARQQFVLKGEATNSYQGKNWKESGHDLDYIFERDGQAYGIEVKNTLGYLDFGEFLTKIRICHHLGVRPVFAVRALPRTWANALIISGGYAMIMRYQFYPWTHRDIAKEIKEKLGLPIDAPRRIADGTMQRFENWIANPERHPVNVERGGRALRKIEEALERGAAKRLAERMSEEADEWDSE